MNKERFDPDCAGSRRAAIGALACSCRAGGGRDSSANATEIVPSNGLTKTANGEDDAKVFGGLAIRGNIIPALQAELGASYRN